MKRTFLAKRNALLSFTSYSWGALACMGVVLLLLVRLVVPDFFWYAAAPVFGASDALAGVSHTFFASFGDAADLTAKNEQLLRENAALAAENQALQEKALAVEGLHGTNAKVAGGAVTITAGVIARPPMSPYDTLVVAQGARAGVTTGMEVFGAGGVPLGLVHAVSDNFAYVTLFSSSGVQTAGWVGEEGTPAMLTGTGGGTFTVSVARTAEVSVGDTVFVPGPGMLPLGIVSRIDSDPSSPSITLRVTPLVNPFSVAWVALRDTGVSTAFVPAAATSTRP